MKLVPKLALALSAGVFAVVAGFTAWRVRGEIELFDQDARRDQRIVAITAGAALAGNLTRDDAVDLARRVDQSREGMRIRYVSMAPDAPADVRPLLPLAGRSLPAPGSSLQLVKPNGDEDADLLVTYVSAPSFDVPQGAMEISQPLASRLDYALKGAVSALASSLAMLLVGGATMAFIGARVVGQPVAELIAAVRRIGGGDFNALESNRRKDEFGELARALRAMSADLAAARSRASAEAEARIRALEQLRHAERLTTLGQLASVLAHEIGTPLNVIAGHGKLVASGKLDPAGVRESAATIGAQAERITNIVRRVLDYARRSPPKRMHVDASDVAGRTRSLLRSLAEQKSVELTLDEPDVETALFADPDQLQQALTNVVLNALHASPEGSSVRLGVRAAERRVGGETQQFVVLEVSDAGPGVDPQLSAKIFEPFFTTKPPGEGTGLGLSVARDIVEEHGGFIDVRPGARAGTTFEIYLPRRSEDAGASSGS